MKVCKTVQRIPGMLLVWEGPDARPSGGAIVNLSIQLASLETERKREGWEQREGWVDRQMTEKDERRENMM